MKKGFRKSSVNKESIAKTPSGISGLDEISDGGLPRGRPTLLCGAAGCGKTLFSMEFLVNGVVEYDEPGVFVSFEERPKELVENVKSLGFDLASLQRRKKIFIDHVDLTGNTFEELGEYSLDGIISRLQDAIEKVNAKRVVLDTIEGLFLQFRDTANLRTELVRLFTWFKDREVTAIITAERGEKYLTRNCLEEYVADCVLLLEHEVKEEASTRRIRIVKYRGSSHGTKEYPFIIDKKGIHVLPVARYALAHTALKKFVSSGIPKLDAMLDGKGFYRGSAVLISGTSGSGKTSLAAHIVEAACKRGERALVFNFEESPDQILRNLNTIGISLESYIKKKTLEIHSTRPSLHGLEQVLITIYWQIIRFKPDVIVMDPISNLAKAGSRTHAASVVLRLVDFIKAHGITGLFTNLAEGLEDVELTEFGVSSLMDAWLALREVETGGERNRGLYVIKSRGMKHSNQIREFVITRNGFQLLDPYLGSEGVLRDEILTGSARLAQEAKDEAARMSRKIEIRRKKRMLDRKQKMLAAQVAALEAEFAADDERLRSEIERLAAIENKVVQYERETAEIRLTKNGMQK